MHIEFNKVTWYSKLGALILFIIVVPAITFYFGRQYEEVRILNSSIDIGTVSNSSKSSVDYLNSTYIIDGESITLKDGKSDNITIFGKPTIADINADKKDDVIFLLVQESSGTGVFFYVATSISKNSVFIGDRISPQNISVDREGIININYVTRREDEPFTATPSVGVTKRLKYINGELNEVKT